jgi:hypothetical protein
MKNGILKVTPVLMLIALVTFSACKKSEEVNDPNIADVSYNKLYSVVPGGPPNFDSIDFNNDGLAELQMEFVNMGVDTGIVMFGQKSQTFQIVMENLTPVPYPRLFNKGDAIPTSSPVYYQMAYISTKISGYRYGVLNGEGYIAFRFSTGTKYQYGWMKVSVNNAFTDFRILEYAYSLKFDTPINVGDK